MAEAVYLTPDNEIYLTGPANTLEDVLENIRRQAKVALNLGCGEVLREGMINCDLYFEHPKIRKVDCRYLDAWPDNTVDMIEAQQLLEHLTMADALAALKEWRRVLRIGGILVVTVPDIGAVLEWLSGAVNFSPLVWREAMRAIYGSQDREGMEHKSGYTPEYLEALLRKIGYGVDFVHQYMRVTPAILIIARKL
jgi:predicted SAM-dependent methyltransferase